MVCLLCSHNYAKASRPVSKKWQVQIGIEQPVLLLSGCLAERCSKRNLSAPSHHARREAGTIHTPQGQLAAGRERQSQLMFTKHSG